MATTIKGEIQVEALPAQAAAKGNESLPDRVLKRLSSVRFGVTLLIILMVCATLGMLIMQVNVGGFDKYYAALSPAKRAVFSDPVLTFLRNATGWRLEGWNILNLFDIYRSYTFIGLMALLSLNIILSSVDRFPSAWRFVRHKKRAASKRYALSQPFRATLKSAHDAGEAERIAAACRRFKLRPSVTREVTRTTVFAERGAWNRLGAYAVHVALLVIFAGGFLTWRLSYVGSLTLEPGASAAAMQLMDFELDQPRLSEHQLPFVIECTDIEQALLDRNGSLDAQNTIDWFTRIRIKDAGRETDAEVHMNKPVDYRGYRFFQSSYEPAGHARAITLEVQRPGVAAEQVTLRRKGTAQLADGTKIRFADFAGDLQMVNGRPQQASAEYRNPGALLEVTAREGGEPRQVIAFSPAALAAPEAKTQATFGDAVFQLKEFERVGRNHTLSVQYDPGARVVYLGFALLSGTLVAVFFFAHQRVWFVIEDDEDGKRRIFVGGSTNRNRAAFEQKFNALVAAVKPQAQS